MEILSRRSGRVSEGFTRSAQSIECGLVALPERTSVLQIGPELRPRETRASKKTANRKGGQAAAASCKSVEEDLAAKIANLASVADLKSVSDELAQSVATQAAQAAKRCESVKSQVDELAQTVDMVKTAINTMAPNHESASPSNGARPDDDAIIQAPPLPS